MKNRNLKNKKAFSLIELSIVILIVGIVVAGVTQSSRLISAFRFSSARNMTQSSPVVGIKDLALWLEPVSDNSLATGTGTYVNVTDPDNSTAIGRWNDINPQSSTKNNAVQATGSKQPLYIRSAINNLPALLFANASAKMMVSPVNIDYPTIPNVTIIMVFKRSGTAADQCFLGNDNGYYGRFVCPTHSAVGGPIVSTGNSFGGMTGLNIFNTPVVFSLIYQYGVTNGSTTYLNGSNVTTFTESHANSDETNFTIGAIGTSSGSPYDGYIAEFIIFTRAIKVEERQAIERYLGKKWGITVS